MSYVIPGFQSDYRATRLNAWRLLHDVLEELDDASEEPADYLERQVDQWGTPSEEDASIWKFHLALLGFSQRMRYPDTELGVREHDKLAGKIDDPTAFGDDGKLAESIKAMEQAVNQLRQTVSTQEEVLEAVRTGNVLENMYTAGREIRLQMNDSVAALHGCMSKEDTYKAVGRERLLVELYKDVHEGPAEQCTICLEETGVPNQASVVIQCGHIFHWACEFSPSTFFLKV